MPSTDHDDSLPLEVMVRIGVACGRFEAAWEAEEPPRLEDFLIMADGPERVLLLRELLRLELEHRRLRGQTPRIEEYVARFPGDGDLIRAVFAEALTPVLPDAQRAGAAGRPGGGEGTDDPDRTQTRVGVGGAGGAQGGAQESLRIPGYEILEVLGQGGMGIVYKARQLGLNRLVALKMIRTLGRPTDDQLARFRLEAEAVAQLKHPHIVPVYSLGEERGQPYFAMEYIEGGSLIDKIDGTPWSPRRAAELVATVAGAVHHAHQKGILHRDLKPHNILLDLQGRPYVTDFGLACYADRLGLSQGDSRPGTPAYMAPEQVQGKSEVMGPATDVFGLGTILYQLLTGQPPHPEKNMFDLLERASRGAITPPRQNNPRIPLTLARICTRALAADPRQRYASAAALETDLRRYLHRRRRLALAAGVVVLLGVFVPLLFLALRPQHDPSSPETPLQGELNVRVWSAKNVMRGLVHEAGVLPIVNGEGVQLEAKLNQPAHVYLLWLGSDGTATPMYPWNRGKGLEVEDIGVPPPQVEARRVIYSPSDLKRGWPMEGPSGLETILLLARRMPLPKEVRLGELIGKLKPTAFDNAREVVVQGIERGRTHLELATEHEMFRRPGRKAQAIDNDLLQLLGRLKPHFELIKAVRFAHRGKGP